MKKILTHLIPLVIFCTILFNASAQDQWALDSIVSTGGSPSGIAITSNNSKLVVTNKASVNIISTLDYSVSNINMSPIVSDSWGVAIAPNDSTAYVTGSAHVVLINLHTNSIAGNFSTPCVATSLYGLAVTPDGRNVIFPDLNSGCIQDGIRIIDATGKTSGSSFVQVPTSGVTFGIALTPDGTSAVVTTWSNGYPKLINLNTSAVQNLDSISYSTGVAVLHKTKEALIDDCSYIDRVSLTGAYAPKQIATSFFSSNTQSIAITADDKYAFVVGDFGKSVISLADNSVIQTFTSGATNVVTASDGSKFYVTDTYNGTVRVYKKIASTGFEDVKTKTFSIYPNPASNVITLNVNKTNNENLTLNIYSISGTLVKSEMLKLNQQRTNIADLPNGVYLITIKSKNETETKKLVIQR
jgi:DNA-binding beta-propeller fold protein YncE